MNCRLLAFAALCFFAWTRADTKISAPTGDLPSGEELVRDFEKKLADSDPIVREDARRAFAIVIEYLRERYQLDAEAMENLQQEIERYKKAEKYMTVRVVAGMACAVVVTVIIGIKTRHW
jgi:hypothetical protein